MPSSSYLQGLEFFFNPETLAGEDSLRDANERGPPVASAQHASGSIATQLDLAVLLPGRACVPLFLGMVAPHEKILQTTYPAHTKKTANVKAHSRCSSASA